MAALRKDGPKILAAMNKLAPVNAGRKRDQCEISGNVEDEQPQQPRSIRAMARECILQMQNDAEEEDAASSPKRVQVPWETRFDQLVSYIDIYQLSYLCSISTNYSAVHSFLR